MFMAKWIQVNLHQSWTLIEQFHLMLGNVIKTKLLLFHLLKNNKHLDCLLRTIIIQKPQIKILKTKHQP